ncbi:class A beta-lactamase [Streptomyces fuscigenes]|uniref:class A beta-lactamase n=1 Tax=Streptomyces fuscigenes TaxID=1528880 RepID=UPI001EFF4135|nr:class A beta-lactamase [Streptomyces fuscigenes]MCF3963438.1 class A beta-lactamase [Streptomyces fuscigenes]
MDPSASSASSAAPPRRAVLSLTAGAVLAAGLAAGRGTAYAAAPAPVRSSPPGDSGGAAVLRELRDLERRHGVRLGVFARNARTGAAVAHRADERFAMCSVFKTLAAAAVLRDLDRDGTFLARRVRYTDKFVTDSGYGPVTGRPENLANGMTYAELCAAAVEDSDNAAGNLLLRALGGPGAVTRFCRSVGDTRTRLDRWEPDLNSAEPWRATDTTSPRAVGTTYGRLLLGDVLARGDRRLLTRWLAANTTDGQRFRAGLPADWFLADKTGGGDAYGVANDVGVVQAPGGAPLVLSVLSTQHTVDGPTDNEVVARAAALVAAALT